MAESVSDEDVRQALVQVMHPEIDLSLVDLGMIKDVIFKCKAVTLSLVLPFLYIPIRDYLINSVKETVENLDADIEVEVKLTEMNQEEREALMTKARKFWKG